LICRVDLTLTGLPMGTRHAIAGTGALTGRYTRTRNDAHAGAMAGLNAGVLRRFQTMEPREFVQPAFASTGFGLREFR